MKVRDVPIGSVFPYYRNPRDNARAVAKTAKSIKNFGWQQPIVVDSKSVIIVGHTRHRAAISLGLRVVPVVVSKLTGRKAQAYRIADNKTGEIAKWDAELLKLELTDLVADDAVAESTGIDLGDISKLLADDGLEQPDLLNGSTADSIDASTYGGATALSRGSAPWRYWKKSKRLKGDVIDFGSGKEQHQFARYDITHAPEIEPLLGQFDTVVCNYVLNCQPTDHLIDLILALLYQLTKANGRCLIAVQTRRESQSGQARNRIQRTPAEWQETIARFFEVSKVDATFCGFVCKRK